MMNLFSRNAIVSFSALFIAVIYAVSGGDGGWWDGRSNSNFAPETFVDKSYEPLFLTGDMFYGNNTYDNDHLTRFSTSIVKDWKSYLGNAMSEKDIEYFAVKDSSATDFNLLLKAIRNKKTISKWSAKFNLNDPKVINFFNFMDVAKTIEDFSTTAPSWDYDTNSVDKSPKMATALVKKVEKNYYNIKDTFLKNRYWFQAMKANFYSDDRNNTILFFNKTQTEVPKNILYYRAMAYVAGVLYKSKDYAKSNFLYSVVFDNCPELRVVTAYSFHPQEQKDFNASLLLAKTDKQKASLWALYGYYTGASRALEQMYALDPKSEHLEYMLTRLINSEEGKLNNLPYKTAIEYKKIVKDSLNKKDYALITKIAQNKNTLKPYLWDIAAGYLEIYNGNHVKATQYFAEAEKIMSQTDLSKNQLRLLNVINKVSATNKMNAKTEKALLPELTWLYSFIKSDNYYDQPTSAFRCGNAISWSESYISKLYLAQGDVAMSELFLRDPDFYLNPSRLETMKAFLTKKSFTPWEKMAASLYEVTLDDIYDYQAVTATYKNELENAQAFMENAPNSGVIEFLGNPFNGRTQDCHDCDHLAVQKVKYTQLDLLKKMNEMSQNIKAGKDVYNNSLLLANAFYNLSYYGNARLFYQGKIINQYSNYVEEKYQSMLFSNKVSKMYYEKALAAASNNEQKAKCIFLLTKIERNEFYESKEFEPDKLDFKAFAGFKKLKKDYAETQYYAEAIAECGYFRKYLGM